MVMQHLREETVVSGFGSTTLDQPVIGFKLKQQLTNKLAYMFFSNAHLCWSTIPNQHKNSGGDSKACKES